MGEREGKRPPIATPIFIAIKYNHLCSLSSLLLLRELATKAAHSKERQESGVIAAKNVTSEMRCRAAGQGAQGNPPAAGKRTGPSLSEGWEKGKGAETETCSTLFLEAKQATDSRCREQLSTNPKL